MVSGAHKGAATQRAIMAAIGMRIDDAHNGCWLPKNTAAISQMPRRLREAVPHSRIHRYDYMRSVEKVFYRKTVSAGERVSCYVMQ
ncbi:AHH domain-containing protein [Microbulbifer rhizosphaerae]|uniref:AHH domain-containing protein n=1 Tax=Microbulbifer rhizosphaerae TaxID=1562603 RepID=UPI003CCDC38B